MKKSMLTFDILTRFENEFEIDGYTEKEIERIEQDARIAMYNRHCHYENGEEWTDNDIYNDFMRILNIDKIELTAKTSEEENNMKEMITMCAIIANANTLTAYAEFVCDYYESTGYICDTFAEIADNNTSIYYNDIIRYISEHVEEVNDAIAELGWDGCGSDLYKAGQAAEYMQIENEMHQHAAEIVEAYAADYIRRNYAEEIPAETWERIAEELENIDTGDRWDNVRDIVDDAMKDTAEETETDTNAA